MRIPVYPKVVEKVPEPPVEIDQNTQAYIAKPKETIWRIAYNFQMTIPELEALNPEIKKGLKEGQEIRVPIMASTTESETIDPAWDSNYNYYKVLPKEGYYRIKKKIGVTQKVLDSLNPNLSELGLQAGMILRVPGQAKGELKIQDDLLVARISLLDSLKESHEIELTLLLPFKAKEIEYDSIEDTRRLLQSRNLHTLSADFYSGVLLAADTLSHYGVSVKLNVFDTQNSISRVNEITNTHDFSDTDVIIGPLIPSNFDYLSTQAKVRKIPKIAPLSTNPVALREAVYQSVTSKNFLRKRMFEYLDKTLNREDNIVLVVDSLSRPVEKELLELFPKATVLRPEKSNYLLPDLVDSLLVDTLPNNNNNFKYVVSYKYSSPNSENEVWLYKHKNGHSWNVDDIITQNEIWNFFSKYIAISSTNIEESLASEKRKLLKIFNIMGQEINETKNKMMLYYYDDGSVKKIISLE